MILLRGILQPHHQVHFFGRAILKFETQLAIRHIGIQIASLRKIFMLDSKPVICPGTITTIISKPKVSHGVSP